jgi:hypothetical protein
MWGCPVAKRFWTSFNIWLSSALDLEVFELTPKETVYIKLYIHEFII